MKMKAKWWVAIVIFTAVVALFAALLFPHKRHVDRDVVILPIDTVTVVDTVWRAVPPETIMVETTKIRVDTIYKELRYTYPEAITELEKVGDTLRFTSIQPIDSGYAYQKRYYYSIFTCGDFKVEGTGDSFFRIGSPTQIYYFPCNHNRVFDIGNGVLWASGSERQIPYYAACIPRAEGLGYWLRDSFLRGDGNA